MTVAHIDAEQFVCLLEDARRVGPGRWVARCPAHDDRVPSLGIRVGDRRPLVLHCLAGCKPADVLAAVGLTWQDVSGGRPPGRSRTRKEPQIRRVGQLPSEPGRAYFRDHPKLRLAETLDASIDLASKLWQRFDRHNREHRFVSEYRYNSQFRRIRFEVSGLDGSRAKAIRPMSFYDGFWWGSGSTVDLFGVPPTHEWLTDRVLWLEGEKDVQTARSLGFSAVCTGGGIVGKDLRPIEGRQVVVVPDNDVAGVEAVMRALPYLRGVYCDLRKIDLPGLPPKGDLTDWVNAGGTTEQLEAMIDEAFEQ